MVYALLVPTTYRWSPSIHMYRLPANVRYSRCDLPLGPLRAEWPRTRTSGKRIHASSRRGADFALKNLRPPLYLLFAARPWAPVRRPTAVLPERTPLRQPRRLRDASGRGFMDPSSSWRRPGDEGIQRPGPHRTEGRFVLRRCLKDARLF